jgi:hypothetical protein
LKTGYKTHDDIKIGEKMVAKNMPLWMATSFDHRNLVKAEGALGLGKSEDNLLTHL